MPRSIEPLAPWRELYGAEDAASALHSCSDSLAATAEADGRAVRRLAHQLPSAVPYTARRPDAKPPGPWPKGDRPPAAMQRRPQAVGEQLHALVMRILLPDET